MYSVSGRCFYFVQTSWGVSGAPAVHPLLQVVGAEEIVPVSKGKLVKLIPSRVGDFGTLKHGSSVYDGFMGMGCLVDSVLRSSASRSKISKMLLISLCESDYFQCFIPQTCLEFADIRYLIDASFMTQNWASGIMVRALRDENSKEIVYEESCFNG